MSSEFQTLIPNSQKYLSDKRFKKLKRNNFNKKKSKGFPIAYYTHDYRVIYCKNGRYPLPPHSQKALKFLHAAYLNKKITVSESELVSRCKPRNTKMKFKDIFTNQKNGLKKKSKDIGEFLYAILFTVEGKNVALKVELRPLEFSKKEVDFANPRK